MWTRISTRWHFARILRLILGGLVIVQSVQMNDKWFAAIGILLFSLALFNLGGCGSGACATPASFRRPAGQSSSNQNIKYEEVDEK